jgi:hypothetical protein
VTAKLWQSPAIKTAKEVDRYTKGARQKKLAASAMEKWEQGRNE